jgi:hypothetical protein
MSLEIRETSNPDHLKLYDGDDWIGEIKNVPLDEEGVALGEPPDWNVEIWSVMGAGKTWRADGESLTEIKQYAQELYEEFAAERRELSKGSRIWTTGSVPMGGKPGWRRR